MKTLSEIKTKNLINIALEQILSAGNPSKVFLFGSFARGDENEDSDLDFYIIENSTSDKQKGSFKYYKSLFHLNHAKDIIVRSTEEFERYKDVLNTLEYNVNQEGILLYERK